MNLAMIGRAVSEKIFKIVDDDDDDGRTMEHGHPINSPCKPNDSGELKSIWRRDINSLILVTDFYSKYLGSNLF